MKKFLITISPICAILLIFMWISWGLEGVCGFGSTIDEAAWDFYTNLKSDKL